MPVQTLNLVVAFEVTPEGTFVNLFRADGGHDRVGPVDFANPNKTYQATLVVPDTSSGPSPPSKMMRKRANRTEESIAEDIGGKKQKASGALPWAKGDVRKKGEHRIEAKTTRSKQYIVRRQELDKIRSECGYGEKPTFIIAFVNPHTLREEDKWALTPYEDWHEAHVNRRSQ